MVKAAERFWIRYFDWRSKTGCLQSLLAADTLLVSSKERDRYIVRYLDKMTELLNKTIYGHCKKEGYLMKRIPVYAAACLFLMTVVWAGLSAGSEEDTGKNLYASKCQICHGAKGDGKGSAAAYLSMPPADFTGLKFWDTHNDKQISNAIENGRGEMPAFDLKPDEIKAIIAYVSHAFKPEKK